jgi:hypothetical protein
MEWIILIAILALAVLSMTLGWNQFSPPAAHGNSADCVAQITC